MIIGSNFTPCLIYTKSQEGLFVIGRARQIGDQVGIIFCADGHLHHRDAHAGWKELLMIGTFVCVALSTTPILDHQVHLPDTLRPDDGFVFPERGHGYVFFVDAFFVIQGGVGATIAIALPLVGDVAEAPGGGGVAIGLLQYFYADVYGAIPIIYGRGPVFRDVGIQLVAFDIVMGLTGRGVIRIFFGVSKLNVEEYKLPLVGKIFG